MRTWPSTTGHVLVLCDGAGGVAGGTEAAELVSGMLVHVPPIPHESARVLLVDVLRRVDTATALDACAGLTTAVVAQVAHGLVQGASVGDSEAWLVSNEADTVLTANQTRKPLVGSGRCTPVAFGPVPMTGTLLLGSDGLFKYCPRETLLRIVRTAPLESLPELLLRACRLPSGRLQDDFSVIVCRDRPLMACAGRP